MEVEQLYAQLQSGQRTIADCSPDEVELLWGYLTEHYQNGEPYDEALYFACAERIRAAALNLGLADAPNSGLQVEHQLELLHRKMEEDVRRRQRARKWNLLLVVGILLLIGGLSVLAVDLIRTLMKML